MASLVDEEAISKLFRDVDRAGDGFLSREEFKNILGMLDSKIWTDSRVDKLFEAADTDNSGNLDLPEIVAWILGSGHLGGSDSEIETDSDSSSSGSSADDDERDALQRLDAPAGDGPPLLVKTRSDHLMRKVQRAVAHEEPMTTIDELYELLTMRGGVVGGTLLMEDLLEHFYEMRLDGFNAKLPNIVPQSVEIEGKDPEDVSVLELGHLCFHLLENPKATLEDFMLVINQEKDGCRNRDLTKRTERHKIIKDLGIDLNAAVGFGTFSSLLTLLSGVMQIDMEHLLSAFAWVRTSRFEMPEAMAIAIMQRGFLKVPMYGCHILETPISANDFARFAHTMHLIDKTETHGIAHGKLSIIFGTILTHLPRLRLERERRRYTDRGSLAKVRPRKRKHLHRRLVGRSQLAILFEELFKKIPSNRVTYRSPLKLVLACLDDSDHQKMSLVKPLNEYEAPKS